jgi:dihydrofolate reductase
VARLGKPLPRRTSVVVSRNAAGVPADGTQVRWAGSLEAALALAAELATAAGDAEVFIGGGVSVYAGALPFAGRVYLTRVHAAVPGDRSMPPGWLDGFTLVHREAAHDPAASMRYEWLQYERVPE